jgi:hypothetical protein
LKARDEVIRIFLAINEMLNFSPSHGERIVPLSVDLSSFSPIRSTTPATKTCRRGPRQTEWMGHGELWRTQLANGSTDTTRRGG